MSQGEQPSSCPSREELAAFNIGDRPPPVLESIAAHIGSCQSCQATLQTLNDQTDSLVCGLRGQAVIESFTEGEYDLVVGLIEEIGLEAARSTLKAGAERTPLDVEHAPARWARQIGNYQLLQKLGRGGMGTVYKALHTKLGKLIALKMLPAERTMKPEAVARFLREMKAVGRLNHPNIVQATDAGETDGTHYLVMELVDGIDLSKLVYRHGPLSVPDACELARQAAIGLEYVRQNGMVHRDIKPSNLMLARGIRDSAAGNRGASSSESIRASAAGSRPPSVKILDLGLALLLEDEGTGQELTATGQVMGTRDYMAPEQADANRAVDIRADIYSLGCTLFKLLTGTVPHRVEEAPAWRTAQAAAARVSVPDIQAYRSDVSAELAAILQRMLAQEPDGRYETPAQVAEKLESFTVDCDLKRLLSETLIADPEPPRPAFEPPRFDATTRPAGSRLRWFALLVIIGLGAVAAGLLAAKVLQKRSPSSHSVPAAGSGPRIQPLAQFVGHTAPIRCAAFTPNGRRAITGSEDKTLRVWDLDTTQQVHCLARHVDIVTCVAVSGDSRLALSGGGDRTARIWDLESGDQRHRLEGHKNIVTSVAFTPDSRQAITTDADGWVRFWEAESGTLVRQFHTGVPHWFSSFGLDARYLLASSGGKLFRLWDLESEQLVQTFRGHTDRVGCVALSPDASVAVSGSDDRTVRVWDTATGNQIRCFNDSNALVFVAISLDGRRILSGSSENGFQLRDIATGQTLGQFDGQAGRIRCLAISFDGTTLLSSGTDSAAQLWEMPK